jgi:hypothetical protein
MRKAVGVASEGWQLLNDTLGDGEHQPTKRYQNAHQTSPF